MLSLGIDNHYFSLFMQVQKSEIELVYNTSCGMFFPVCLGQTIYNIHKANFDHGIIKIYESALKYIILELN